MGKQFWSFVALMLAITSLSFVAIVWQETSKTFKDMNQRITLPSQSNRDVILTDGQPLTILLLGIDTRPGDKGRTDAIIFLALNPTKDSGAIVSLPRDLSVTLASSGENDKLNHAYAYGGVDETVQTVEKFLDVPVNHVVVADMDGFRDAIDLIGGIEIDNKFAFESGGDIFPKGNQRLNGKEALEYVRMRKEDPFGDFGRQERQREVVTAFGLEASNQLSPNKIRRFLDLTDEHVATTITMKNAFQLSIDYRAALLAAENLEIRGVDGRGEDGLYYWYADELWLKNVKNDINELLEQ